MQMFIAYTPPGLIPSLSLSLSLAEVWAGNKYRYTKPCGSLTGIRIAVRNPVDPSWRPTPGFGSGCVRACGCACVDQHWSWVMTVCDIKRDASVRPGRSV